MWKFVRPKKRRIYLDHAAATPLNASVERKMETVLTEPFANPSAIHQEGVAARLLIEEAREKLARTLKIRPEHVTYTASGTESNNLAILGTVYAAHKAGAAYENMEIITTAVEHPSVAETCRFAASLGVQIREVDLTEEGLIDLSSFASLLTENTILVTAAYINSEIGTIQPLGKIARLVRKYEEANDVRIYVHADAAQAPYWLPCQFDKLPVDIVSLDAGKCGGPKGVGVLAARHGVALEPVMFGGPQEAGLRPATENLVGIVGGSEAVVAAQANREKTSQRVAKLRDQLLAELVKLEGVVVNGSLEERVANNINISVPGVDSEFLVISLDEAGVAASTKSACSGATGGGSKVVEAITGDPARATSTLRLTLGPDTTAAEIKIATQRIVAVIEKLQKQQSNIR